MTKEDQVAFHKWDATRAKTAHSNIQAWESACAYKDKRITELKAEVKDAVRLLDMAHEAACLNDNYSFAKTIEVFLNRSEGGADECKWVEDKTDRCLWNSSCGWVFRLDTDDPPDIGWKYCPRCGKPIRTAEGGADD